METFIDDALLMAFTMVADELVVNDWLEDEMMTNRGEPVPAPPAPVLIIRSGVPVPE